MILGKLLALVLTNGMTLLPGKEVPKELVNIGTDLFIAAIFWVDGVPNEQPHWEINCSGGAFARLFQEYEDNLGLLQRAMTFSAKFAQLPQDPEQRKAEVLALKEEAYKDLDDKESRELHELVKKMAEAKEELAKASQQISIQIAESQVARVVRQMSVEDMANLILVRQTQEASTRIEVEEDDDPATGEESKPEEAAS